MKHWTLDDIEWERFDPDKVDPDVLKVVKSASLVEHNGRDYATYLCNVFADDSEFQDFARAWAAEEVQHGQALGRWAEMADPGFDFAASFKRFTDGYRLPLDARKSVRGTRAGELVARCIVETGTSTYYTAMADAVEEPVLRQISKRIAGDEFRHYKLFYTHLNRYLEHDRIGRLRRLAVVFGRLNEADDDELSYAYFAANAAPGEIYDRKSSSRAYARRVYSLYRPSHIDQAMAMCFKAAGIDGKQGLRRLLSRFGYWMMSNRAARLTRANA